MYDFMSQITSRLESIERKVDANQQNLEKLLKKIEKRKASRATLNHYFLCNSI